MKKFRDEVLFILDNADANIDCYCSKCCFFEATNNSDSPSAFLNSQIYGCGCNERLCDYLLYLGYKEEDVKKLADFIVGNDLESFCGENEVHDLIREYIKKHYPICTKESIE